MLLFSIKYKNGISDCNSIALAENVPCGFISVYNCAHGGSAVNKNVFASFEFNIAVMRANELVFEKNDGVFAIITNACCSGKYKIFFAFKFTTNYFEPSLFCKLLEQTNTKADQQPHNYNGNCPNHRAHRKAVVSFPV